MVAESAIFKERVEVDCPYLPDKEVTEPETNVGIVKSYSAGNDQLFGRSRNSKMEISAGWRRLAELCDEANSHKTPIENTETGKQPALSGVCEVSEANSPEIRISGDRDVASDTSSDSLNPEIRRKVQNEVGVASDNSDGTKSSSDEKIPVGNDTISRQGKRCDSGCVKIGSHTSFDREIELLFENPDDENPRNMQTLKNDCRLEKGLDSGELRSDRTIPAVPSVTEDGGNFLVNEIKQEPEESVCTVLSGDDRRMIKQETALRNVDKKRKKQQKQKLAGGESAFSDSRNLTFRKRQRGDYIDSPRQDSEQTGEASALSSSPLHRSSEQLRRQDKRKKMEESKDEARANAEKRKRDKEYLMKREREEIERQKRELEEKERRRAAERERRRKEEEQREAREREERERRRKEREDRERLKKLKESRDEKLKNEDSRKQRERSRTDENRLKRESRSDSLRSESRNSELMTEASILDQLFGVSDMLKPSTATVLAKEEQRRRPEERRSR